jgi:ribonuclease-3
MVSKEKKIFHYDIYEDNGIDGTRFFGKLSIDGKVIAKPELPQKESRRKASQRTYFALQEKMDKKNIFIKTTSFSFIN